MHCLKGEGAAPFQLQRTRFPGERALWAPYPNPEWWGTNYPRSTKVNWGSLALPYHSSRGDSDLEAFSHNPTDGSFAPLAPQPRVAISLEEEVCMRLQETYWLGQGPSYSQPVLEGHILKGACSKVTERPEWRWLRWRGLGSLWEAQKGTSIGEGSLFISLLTQDY